MTIDQIDRALAAWQTKISAASANLLDLDDLLTYKRLRGGDGMAPARLTGATQARVAPALDAIQLLWKYLQILTETIQTAIELRKTVRPWNTDAIVRQVGEILNGSSIALPKVQTPLEQRGLVSEAARVEKTTPEKLLRFMEQAFDLAKKTIMEVDSAWQNLEPALADAAEEIDTLQAAAQRLGERLPEIDAAQRAVSSARDTIQADPLGAADLMTSTIDPLLRAARAAVDQASQACAKVSSDLERAATLLAQLRSDNARAEAAVRECLQKIADPLGLLPAMNEQSMQDLEQWLATLKEHAGLGRRRAAQIGLERWFQNAEAYCDAVQRALRSNCALLETLAELRGRLSSVRAKARAYAQRGVTLPPQLEISALAIDRLLQERPTRVADATAALLQYEEMLGRAIQMR